MKRLWMMVICVGMLMVSTFGIVHAQENDAYKKYDFQIDAETEINNLMFKEYGQLLLSVNDIAKSASYHVNDEHIVISFQDSAALEVAIHLSYDTLDGTEIEGTIEDVKLIYQADVFGSDASYDVDFLDKNYTLELVQETDDDTSSILEVPDDRVSLVHGEMYILRYDGLDEYVYFYDNNQLWVEERQYQPSGFYPEGYYDFKDEYLILEMDAYYDYDGRVQLLISYDDLAADITNAIVEDLVWVSSEEQPEEFDADYEYIVGAEIEMLKQDRVSSLLDTEFSLDISDTVISLREDNIAIVEQSGEEIEGTYTTGLGSVQVTVEEADGVTTHLYLPFSSLSVEEGTVTGVNITHEFDREMTPEDRESFRSIFGRESQ